MNMFTKNIIFSIIFLNLTSIFLDCALYCLNSTKNVCHPCEKSAYNIHYCEAITKGMKIVSFGKIAKVNYESYLNSNIRIINERSKVTLYSCYGDYIQVKSYSYYPIKEKVHLKSIHLAVNHNPVHAKFQKCLEVYCFVNHNIFVCFDETVNRLDFFFNSIITTNCVQNITAAHIASNKITNLKFNLFFYFGRNLIYLHLNFLNLESIDCFVFQNLIYLRIIEFSTNLIKNLKSYKCILNHHINLIKISIGEDTIWNNCDFSTELTTLANEIGTVGCNVMSTEEIFENSTEIIDYSNNEYSIGIYSFMCLIVVCGAVIFVTKYYYKRRFGTKKKPVCNLRPKNCIV